MSSRARITAIIPAAGSGIRLGAGLSKPLVKISGSSILVYTLKAVSSQRAVKEIIIVANLSNTAFIESIVRKYHFKKVKQIVLGGASRRLSIENGLREVSEKCDYVMIHDAVRPFADELLIKRVIDSAIECGAAVAGVPVKSTIKRIGIYRMPVTHKLISIVRETVKRESLWEIQTPQVFKKSIILKAYQKYPDKFVTDDSTLVEKCGVKVSVVLGSYFNIKITTPEDLILAEAVSGAKKDSRWLKSA